MKKFLYTALFALLTSFAISACSDENIKPADGATDVCQFFPEKCKTN